MRLLRPWSHRPGWPLRTLVGGGLVLALGAVAVQLWVGAGLVRTNVAASDAAGRQSLLASLIQTRVLRAGVAHHHGDPTAFDSAVAEVRRYVELFVENVDVLNRGGTAPAVPLAGQMLPPIRGVPVGALDRAPAPMVFWSARAASRQWAPVLAHLDSLSHLPFGSQRERASAAEAPVALAASEFDALSAALTARNQKLVVLSRWLPVVFLGFAAFLAVLVLVQLAERLSLATHISQIEGQLQARGLAAAALDAVQRMGRVPEIWRTLAQLLQRHTDAFAAAVYRPAEASEDWQLVAAAGMDPHALAECRILPQQGTRVLFPPYGQEIFPCATCPVRHAACPAETQGIGAVALVPGHGERAPEELFGLAWRGGTKATRDVDVRAARLLAPHARLAVDRVRTLEQISEAKRQWEATVDAVPALICVTDWTRFILRVNRAFAQAVGRRPAQIVGLPLAEVLGMDPESLPWRPHGGREGDGLGEPRSVLAEAQIPALGGRLAATRSRTVGLAPADAFVYVFRNIARERAVEEAAERSQRLMALGRLVSGIAHELNNPLASVLAAAEMLAVEPCEAACPRELVETILEETRRCRDVLRTLASVSRPGDPGETHKALVDLAQTIRAALRLRQADLAAQDIEVEANLADRCVVAGDRGQIEQVLLHLIANADEAMRRTPASQRRLTIRARPESARWVVLDIADTGPGMSDEELAHLFDPFFTGKDAGQHSGLGLSFAHGIVRAHGGEISAANRPGGGAAFTIRLPAHTEAHVTDAAAPDVPAAATGGPRSYRILLVDDEARIVRTLRRFLELRGHGVKTASTVQAALRLLDKHDFDLVVCDIKMPGGGGRAVYGAIRDRQPRPHIVFCTGDVANPDAAALLSESSAPLLAKPFELQELEQVIERTVGAR
ncbi:MAG: response regulator [Gemmatimonadetes bacterium]|nr:response regulator [Gemmatimonadota bacterium]